MALITQAEWARRQGVSREAVRKQVQSGRLQLVNGKVDENQAKQDLLSYTKTSSTRERLFQAKLENEIAKGKILKLEVAEKEQSLIAIADVKKVIYERSRAVRNAILNVPDRCASLLASITDPGELHKVLTQELRTALEELSREEFH